MSHRNQGAFQAAELETGENCLELQIKWMSLTLWFLQDSERRIIDKYIGLLSFSYFNQRYGSTQCDLHRLSEEDAEWFTIIHLSLCVLTGTKEFTLITGRGKNSTDGIPVLKGAMRTLLGGRRSVVSFRQKQKNIGAFIVTIQDFEELSCFLDGHITYSDIQLLKGAIKDCNSTT